MNKFIKEILFVWIRIKNVALNKAMTFKLITFALVDGVKWVLSRKKIIMMQLLTSKQGNMIFIKYITEINITIPIFAHLWYQKMNSIWCII